MRNGKWKQAGVSHVGVGYHRGATPKDHDGQGIGGERRMIVSTMEKEGEAALLFP